MESLNGLIYDVYCLKINIKTILCYENGKQGSPKTLLCCFGDLINKECNTFLSCTHLYLQSLLSVKNM